MNGLGNVIRGPVIMTPLITDNYLGYRPRGVISTGPSPAFARPRDGRRGRRETSGARHSSVAEIRHGTREIREIARSLPIINNDYV